LTVLGLALSSSACGLSFERSAHDFAFPGGLLNADLGPRPVARSDVDPFGWAVRPDSERAVAKAERQAKKPPEQVARAAEESATLAKENLGEQPKRPIDKKQSTSAAALRKPITAAQPQALLAAPTADAYDAIEAARFVMAVYTANGVELQKASRSGGTPSLIELYQHAYRGGVVYQSKTPVAGDLVFFHNTYDRNHDERWNDWYSWVAIVESVEADGTVTCLGFIDGAVHRVELNQEADGNNSILRADALGNAGAANKLFAGYANLLGEATKVVVIDNWQPGMKVEAALLGSVEQTAQAR
jgi:hypothetical protein